MIEIRLIGIRTPEYDSMRQLLLGYAGKHAGRIVFIEKNDLSSILRPENNSIPLVELGDTKFYYDRNNPASSIRQLRKLLDQRLAMRKVAQCKNCKTCRCPAERAAPGPGDREVRI